MAPQLVQKRHFAADALPPHAVDKPLHVGWPGSRRPVQDEACGDEFACAVLALIAIGFPCCRSRGGNAGHRSPLRTVCRTV
jgi:hypothetical protein